MEHGLPEVGGVEPAAGQPAQDIAADLPGVERGQDDDRDAALLGLGEGLADLQDAGGGDDPVAAAAALDDLRAGPTGPNVRKPMACGSGVKPRISDTSDRNWGSVRADDDIRTAPP